VFSDYCVFWFVMSCRFVYLRSVRWICLGEVLLMRIGLRLSCMKLCWCDVSLCLFRLCCFVILVGESCMLFDFLLCVLLIVIMMLLIRGKFCF